MKTGDVRLTQGQIKTIITCVKNNYEKILSVNFWNLVVEGKRAEEYLEDDVLSLATRLVLVCSMAEDSGISLNDDERDAAVKDATDYYTLNKAELESFVDEGQVTDLFIMMRLSDKVFDEYTKHVETAVSIDEARVVRIEYIYSRESISKLQSALEAIEEGYEFEVVANQYSEASEQQVDIGRNEMAAEFEAAAFNLAEGEVSQIISCDAGYYVIKCIDDNVNSMYEARVASIIDKRKNAIFEDAFANYFENAYIDFDSDAWKKAVEKN